MMANYNFLFCSAKGCTWNVLRRVCRRCSPVLHSTKPYRKGKARQKRYRENMLSETTLLLSAGFHSEAALINSICVLLQHVQWLQLMESPRESPVAKRCGMSSSEIKNNLLEFPRAFRPCLFPSRGELQPGNRVPCSIKVPETGQKSVENRRDIL